MESEATFASRYDELYAVGHQVAYRVLGSRADAEDIAHEALARALVRWQRIEPYAAAWVTRTASNLAIDGWRYRSRRSAIYTADAATSGAEQHVELRADLLRALRSISRRQRDVVVLRYLMDLPEREVADLLGLTEGTIKQHATRGLAALRRRLGPDLVPEPSDPHPDRGSEP